MERQAIGVDLGGSNLRAAHIRFAGDQSAHVVRHAHIKLTQRDPDKVACLLRSVTQDLSAGVQMPIGVGLAAMLRGFDGMVSVAPNLGWREVNFAQVYHDLFAERLHLENDLSAIVWGEYRFGAARGLTSVLCVYVGTGIGGGLIVDHKLWRGAGNVGGEIGHVKAMSGGRVCGCGERGCLEAYVGGRYIAMQAQESPSKAMLEQVSGNAEALVASHIDLAAAHGDTLARAIIMQAGEYLGSALASAVTVLNPDGLLLGGSVWESCPTLRKQTLATFESSVNPPSREILQIREASLGDQAGLYGAADLALQNA